MDFHKQTRKGAFDYLTDCPSEQNNTETSAEDGVKEEERSSVKVVENYSIQGN